MIRIPLITHQSEAHLDRCVPIAGIAVCARCLGTYSVLLLLIAIQIAIGRRALAHPPIDLFAALLLSIPALADWGRAMLGIAAGSNTGRIVTGGLLGAALARSIFLHLVHPFNVQSSVHFAALAVVATGVLLRARGRAIR